MDSLEIDGKEYVSARRAAKEHGYVADYIGQLIRGGKLAGKKVGRAWYVSKESLEFYVKAEDSASNAEGTDGERHASTPAVVKDENSQETVSVLVDTPTGKTADSAIASSERATESTYELLRYVQDDGDIDLQPVLGGHDASADTPLNASLVPLRRIENEKTGLVETVEDGSKGSADTAVEADTQPQSEIAQNVPTGQRKDEKNDSLQARYFGDGEGARHSFVPQLVSSAAVVLALLGLSLGMASIFATKEVTYQNISLSASLQFFNLDIPR